jgi:hypothetical protein
MHHDRGGGWVACRDNAPGMSSLRVVGLAVLVLSACAPALDWRRVAPEGLGVTAMFPCRPSSRTRDIELGGQRLVMTLYACTTEGLTFALSSVDVGDVRLVGDILAELSASALRNLGSERADVQAVAIPGMTPHERARRLRFSGKLPNGDAVIEHTAVFSRAARIYQATVVGAQPTQEAVQPFFDGIRLDR